MMKVLILLSFLACSIHAANPDADNGMMQTMYNYLKSQPILLQEEQRQVSSFYDFKTVLDNLPNFGQQEAIGCNKFVVILL